MHVSRPPLRVLVVDDDVDARLLVGAMVETYCDALVTLVASVDEAIDSVRRVLPRPGGAAMMPRQDGLDLRRIRGFPRAARVPVLVYGLARGRPSRSAVCGGRRDRLETSDARGLAAAVGLRPAGG
jgi:CheY-like chemotaxis protein